MSTQEQLLKLRLRMMKEVFNIIFKNSSLRILTYDNILGGHFRRWRGEAGSKILRIIHELHKKFPQIKYNQQE